MSFAHNLIHPRVAGSHSPAGQKIHQSLHNPPRCHFFPCMHHNITVSHKLFPSCTNPIHFPRILPNVKIYLPHTCAPNFGYEPLNPSNHRHPIITKSLFLHTQIKKQQRRLKAEDLVVELGHGLSGLVAKRGGSLLHGGNHGRGSADEHLDVGGGGRAPFLSSPLARTPKTKKEN